MTRTFVSEDEAKATAACYHGVDPGAVLFEPVPDFEPVIPALVGAAIGSGIFSEEEEAEIKAQCGQQHAYKFTGSQGEEVQIIIGPRGWGFECWEVAPNGMSIRYP